MDVGGGTGPVLQLIGAGDPFDLAGFQIGAGGEGEAGHRIRESFELRESYHGSGEGRAIQGTAAVANFNCIILQQGPSCLFRGVADGDAEDGEQAGKQDSHRIGSVG
jgi:hypothetical protein